jgi:hypothetical protein
MPRTKKASASRRKGSRASARGSKRSNGSSRDAIALLKSDHREVESLFSQFEKRASPIASRSSRCGSAKR